MKSKIAERILSETSNEQKQKAINYGNSIVTEKQVEEEAKELCEKFSLKEIEKL